jgi:hypothetical protein
MITPEMLAEFDLFREVSKDTVKEVDAISETIKVNKDDFVFREGEGGQSAPARQRKYCPARQPYITA